MKCRYGLDTLTKAFTVCPLRRSAEKRGLRHGAAGGKRLSGGDRLPGVPGAPGLDPNVKPTPQAEPRTEGYSKKRPCAELCALAADLLEDYLHNIT